VDPLLLSRLHARALVLGSDGVVGNLGVGFLHFGRTRASAQRLRQVGDEHPAITFPRAGRCETPLPVLEFDHVRFAYDSGPVLHDISFTLAPGHALAVIGPSGAGKSTLVRLAARAWDPSAGQIRLGGRDLRSYPAHTLATTLGGVSQDAFIFSATIRQNLDPIAERLVFDIIEQLARERAVLVATHRIDHLGWADDILVLEHGRIVERVSKSKVLSTGDDCRIHAG
jgi:ABC-type multidrug transport system fused ATPase/permease subunit